MSSFQLPLGEPIRLFAKLKAPGQNVGDDVQISNNEIKIKNENKWTQFENIYDQQTRAKDLFDSDLSKCIPFIIDGYSVSIFVFGTESSDKREILNGIIINIFNGLFYELSQKSKSFEIELIGLEIFDDTIYDLMDINKDNLVIEYGIDGPSILGISKTTIRSNNDFTILFNEMMDNRIQKPTQFGSASSKSSFFLKLKIINTDNDTVSILQFIEFPASDKLMENPAQIRMKEGSTLNREIIGLSNLINSFDDKSLETPYYDCKTNQLLQDSFGGNCKLFGIICLNISDSLEINKLMLKYCNKLNLIENYPVINNNRIRGLLIKYHKRYNHILTQFQLFKKQHLQNMNDHTNSISNTEAKLLEFRSLLIEKEKELIALHGDKDKLSESYGQFRNKYNELMDKKKELQQELIISEEKCLSIHALMIDLQIENNKLKNNESIIRSELETKLIGAENDILETGMREENLSKEINELRKQTQQLLQEKKTLSIEYVALRSNYNQINNQYDQQKDEQQQLNVQLINLINANKALEESSSRLTQENEILLNKNNKLSEIKEKLESKYKNYEVEMMKIKTLNDKQAIELVKYEVEIGRIKTSMDVTKSEYQKKWLKLSKEKEIELQNITNQRTSENQHNRAQTQQLERDNDTLKGQIRIANRKINNQQNKNKEYQSQINILNKELTKSRELIKEKTEEFRRKLLLYLQRVDNTNDNKDIQIEDLKTTQKKLYQELIDQHHDREQELMQQSENQRKKNRKLNDEYQSLTSKFILLQDFIHDIVPDIDIPSNIIYDDTKNNKYSSDIEQYDEKLKNRINFLEKELEREKRGHINTAERAQIEQEGIQKELLSLKKLLRDEHSDCDPMSRKLKQEYQENLSKLKGLQLTLQQQMDHNISTQKQRDRQINLLQTENINLKTKLAQYTDNNYNGNTTNDIDIEKYQKQIYNLKKKYKENDIKYKKKIQQYQTQISQLEINKKNGDEIVGDDNNNITESNKNITWERVRKLEKEKAELIAKVHALESELLTIEKHHKKEIQKYKKLIVKLKNK